MDDLELARLLSLRSYGVGGPDEAVDPDPWLDDLGL